MALAPMDFFTALSFLADFIWSQYCLISAVSATCYFPPFQKSNEVLRLSGLSDF